jgi:taurine dioxygenase
MEIEPLTEHGLGAAVRGVNVGRALEDEMFGAIRNAFHRHAVLVFPAQDLSEAAHVAFSRRFGPLEIHPAEQYLLPGHPEILLLTNERKADGSRVSIADGGVDWHSDLSYMQAPSLGSLLYAKRAPDIDVGGETEWMSLYAAYERLPAALQARIAGLEAIHVFDQEANPRLPPPDTRFRDRHSAGLRAKTPPVRHPIVRVHPETGRKALYVSIRFTVGIAGLPPVEGDALLDELLACLEDNPARYRHRWRTGDLVMWDNRCLNHRAVGGVVPLPHVRRLQRTTIAGSIPLPR